MRFKFTGKYGDLKDFGFEYVCSKGPIYYFWRPPNGGISHLYIKKEGSVIGAGCRLESSLTLILPYIKEHLNGVVPDEYYYSSRSDTVSHVVDKMDVEYESCKDFPNVILADTKRYEQGLPNLRTVFHVFNEGNEIDVLYELYEKNYLTLVDDFSYPRNRIFNK